MTAVIRTVILKVKSGWRVIAYRDRPMRTFRKRAKAERYAR